MKQLGLSLLLLASVSAVCATTVDVELVVDGQPLKPQNFEYNEEKQILTGEFEGYHLKSNLTKDEEGLQFNGEISTCNQAGEKTVVSQPVVNVAWEQEGVVTFGDENGQSLKLIVRAHK